MINTAIIFDHRGRTKRGQSGPIEIRVTVNRKPYYINTGVRVRANEFKYGAIVNRGDMAELNERLRIISNKVETEINYCIENDTPVDVAAIRRNILDVGNSIASKFEVVEWMDERVKMLQVSPGTRSHYKTMLAKFMEFGRIRQWSDVTIDNIYRWDAWLHTLEKPQTDAQKRMGLEPERLTDAGVSNYHKCLKHLLHLAEKTQQIDRNPYDLLKGEFKRGDRENVDYLTEAEMQAIETANLQRGSQLDVVRDMFVMQMYTGMAYADLMKFRIEDYKEVDGRWVANAERVKSGVAFIGHLLPPVVRVLEKYGWHLPYMTNQAYNRALKTVGERAGISTSMHSHLARHTFATYMLSNGVKIENLQRMLGHKDIAMTQRYAKTLAQSVHDEFDMIEKIMKKG